MGWEYTEIHGKPVKQNVPRETCSRCDGKLTAIDKKRQDGWCGLCRNEYAFRQSLKKYTVAELKKRKKIYEKLVERYAALIADRILNAD